MSHPTSQVLENPNEVTAIVLVGPPASGKSTVRSIMSDYGVVGCDIFDHYSGGDLVDHNWTDTVDDVLKDAVSSLPKVCAIEGVLNNEELENIRDAVGDMLVIRVNASSRDDRIDRFVDRELSGRYSDSEAVEVSLLTKLRTTADRRYHTESPYPTHDVEIVNSDDVPTSELAERVANIVSAVSDVDRDEFTSPKEVAAGDI